MSFKPEGTYIIHNIIDPRPVKGNGPERPFTLAKDTNSCHTKVNSVEIPGVRIVDSRAFISSGSLLIRRIVNDTKFETRAQTATLTSKKGL
jgi:hypothetical protein